LAAALAAALLAACAPPTPPAAATAAPAEAAVSAADAFAELSRLAGRWRPADTPGSPLRIRFHLTAGGTVLVESWERAGKPHSLTLYHRDGAALLATHYCPQGNQPRLALAGTDGDGLHFASGTRPISIPPPESHQHDLWFDLTDPDRPVRAEIYSGRDGPAAQERLRLMRDTDGQAPA
jgi:hypothetical protein